MTQPAFVKVPTKTVEVTDYDKLLDMVREAPVLLRIEDHPTIKCLYLHVRKVGAGKLSIKTVHWLVDGNPVPAHRITLKPNPERRLE